MGEEGREKERGTEQNLEGTVEEDGETNREGERSRTKCRMGGMEEGEKRKVKMVEETEDEERLSPEDDKEKRRRRRERERLDDLYIKEKNN